MSYIESVEISLYLTVECSGKRKNLVLRTRTESNIQTELVQLVKTVVPDCRLPGNGSLRFRISAGALELESTLPLTINGVASTERILKKSDRIVFGDARLIFSSYGISETPATVPAAPIHGSITAFLKERILFPVLLHLRGLRTAAIIATITAACIIAGCLALPATGDARSEHAKPADSAEKASGPSASRSAPAEIPMETDELPGSDMLRVEPGGVIPEIDLDILFIHAHPDDESLDFGCMLALCESAGLKTGLVTFTDGESGLDLYPSRKINGIYPDHYMEGSELASVRKRELERAAGVLGIDLLVRLGLPNHPYNGISDELSVGKIMEDWGGEHELGSRLMEIILRTRPETVIAPEGPGKAREHFEHESVGYITAEVMASFEPDDYKAPKRFLTCIDPRQHHLYPEAVFIPAGTEVRRSAEDAESSLRQIQLDALMNHRTQNDAVNVGTGFLPKYPAEYYKIQYWRSNRSWAELVQNGLP